MIQNSAACPPPVTDHAQWSVASAKEGEMSRRDEKEGYREGGKKGGERRREGGRRVDEGSYQYIDIANNGTAKDITRTSVHGTLH